MIKLTKINVNPSSVVQHAESVKDNKIMSRKQMSKKRKTSKNVIHQVLPVRPEKPKKYLEGKILNKKYKEEMKEYEKQMRIYDDLTLDYFLKFEFGK
jgi:hypothetical protein